jgi:uncharacterized protein (DUF58 family)
MTDDGTSDGTVQPARTARPVGLAPLALRSDVGRGARSRLTGSGRVVFVGLALVLTGVGSAGRERFTPVLIALVLAIIAVMGLGLVVPTALVRRIRVRVTPPRAATVGDHTSVAVVASGVAGDVVLRPLDPDGDWVRASSGTSVDVAHRCLRRGVFGVLRVEVRSSTPLGLFEAHHVVEVAMDRPIAVGPRPLEVRWKPGAAPLDGSDLSSRASVASGDLVRTVRPYTPGDPARLVHWPSTARTGDLVIRELEPPNPVGQAIVLDLTGLGDETERAASYAMGACIAVLAGGGRLVLCSHDPSGPRSDEITDRRHASLLLAGATGGVPGAAPEGWPVVEIGR